MDSSMTKILILVIVFIILQGCHGHQDFFHFGYSKQLQKEWAHMPNTSCGGKHQSPIHIDSKIVIPEPIPALEMVGFHNMFLHPLNLSNNGHSVQLRLPPTDGGSIKIFGALLDSHYRMELLHFHWGDTNCRGSEHVINHVRFPLEMHIVFYKQHFTSIQEASKHKSGLAVLAFIFQIREKDNRALNPLVKEFSKLTEEGNSVLMKDSFTLSSILTRNMEVFYTYRGSLTTPPCTEAVTWIVFPDPLPVSYNQMRMFRSMKSHESKLVDNFRHLQEIGHRKVFVRQGPSNSSFHHNRVQDHLRTKFWE
uniref:Carbonic anhydrase n=1 Tax=Sogatella furcifera TaxID=113103 RepID=A0A2S1TNS1_SOGFU|nr:carbonic anhydrase 2 [Sogatella furcifera]